MMFLLLLLGTFCLYYSATSSLVDFKACQQKFNCTRNLTPKDCQPSEFLDTQLTNGCCHGCRSGIGRGESGCKATGKTKKCAPGLMCDEDFYCILDRTSCFHTMHFDDNVITWKPTCEIDGSFSAKQCRGDKLTGRCFCISEKGERIFGWDWWRNAEDMPCACSRQRFKSEMAGRLDVTLHCLPNGDFEELQCDMGICWCADEKEGHIQKGTVAVPEALWTYLPCYNSSLHGDQYLRKCESAAFAQKILLTKLINRGAINASPNQIQCNYDGSFGNVVIENRLAHCQMPDGSKLNFALPTKNMNEMNCNCGRDEKIFTNAGIGFNLRCQVNGNYESIQDQNGNMFCVDEDGYAVTPLFQPNEGLDCEQFLYSEQEDIFIEDIDEEYYE